MAAVPSRAAFQETPPAPENLAVEPVPPPPPMGVGPQVPEEAGRNVLALVSLIASLFFPLGIVLSLLGVVARSNGLPMALSILASIGASLTGIVGIPATLCAIATGHVAWIRRKRYSQANRLGWMAIGGLVIGYPSVAFVLAVIAIIIAALLQEG
jgi:cellulose synthase/poly-beta-1,6-N-acetylglucosamine synthase-like glycosyltransferase